MTQTAAKPPRPPVNNLESLMTSLCEQTDGDTVTVRDLLDAAGRRSYGPLLLLLDHYLKPRFTILTAPLFVQLIGLICVAASLITIPLGLFPFGPVLPGLTILLFGLGLTARDGVFLLLAAAALTGAILILIRVLPRVLAVVHSLFG